MNTLNYKYLFFLSFSFLSLFFFLILPVHSSPALSQEERTNKIIETQKQKIQECIALSKFQDSCYFELCKDRNPYICTEDILDAIVQLADPQKAMDVLNGVMESSLFNIQTDGHLLAHTIGNSLAYHYGFSGENFLKCPPGYGWACTHGFFEDVLEVQSDPVKAAEDICGSAPEHPFARKELCYHGVGHIFMFNESYDLMSALFLCDHLSSLIGQETCYQGVLMEKNEKIQELGKELGYRNDDVLAPCNRLDYKYRAQCYINHGSYFCAHRRLSMKDAANACLNAGDHIDKCMDGISMLTTRPAWQRCLLDFTFGEPYREELFLENAARLCNMIPPDYIERCQSLALSGLLGYHRFQDSMDFCSLYGVNKGSCFYYIGAIFSANYANKDEAVEMCDMAPEEYKDSCIKGTQADYAAAKHGSIQQDRINKGKTINNQAPHSEMTQQNHKGVGSMIQGNGTDGQYETEPSSSVLFYLFIGLGCILLIAPLTYYFKCSK